jgi:hypothetical protein
MNDSTEVSLLRAFAPTESGGDVKLTVGRLRVRHAQPTRDVGLHQAVRYDIQSAVAELTISKV